MATTITRLANGNIEVSRDGNTYSLNPSLSVFRDVNKNTVVVRDSTRRFVDSFDPDNVQSVTNSQGVTTSITSLNQLYTELSRNFFF